MAINHKAAKEFAKRWSGKTWSEDQFARTFWMDLLKSIYDIEYYDTSNVIFEYRTSASGKIDLWLRNLSTMVEMKSSGVDLDKPEMRQGELKTPFKQVYDYAVSFPRREQPDYLITCNFDKFRVYSRKEHGDINLEDSGIEFSLNDLGNKPEYLSFLVDPQNSRLYHEREISEAAGQLIGKLYDMLRDQYLDPDSEESKHSLNVLCVRLVFCLFCEDAGLFGEMDALYNFLKDVPASNIRLNLQRLFHNLDLPKENRDKYDDAIKVFPYINGGLFREEVEIPNFTDAIKEFLLNELSQNVDWSKISPTIFGGIFESTLNPETRRKGGMHYTSPENIHKVIDPLFLNELKAEFEDIRTDEDLSAVKRRNRYKKFHEKLCSLVFLDPACGSGNFLTETYICLKNLEYAVLKEYKSKQVSVFDSNIEGEIDLRVSLDQFYGIEINDFAVSVAETALWISRLKANQEYMLLLDLDEKDFPLSDSANIICKNALRYDWNDLVDPLRVTYILGNPPFSGARLMGEEQKADVMYVFDKWENAGNLDYVSCWFKKCSDFITGSEIKCALVSTNSICQGESVATLWEPLFKDGIVFNFAHKTFNWSSEAAIQAAVHCIIVGFSKCSDKTEKVIYTDNVPKIVSNINAYLMDAPNIFVKSRSKPLCDIPNIGIGNKPIDNGYYLFSEDEMAEFINAEPASKQYFKPWIGANELTQGVKRYCLWLGDCTREQLSAMPLCLDRVQKVRDYRLASKSEGTRKLAAKPTRFHVENMPLSTSVVIPEVTTIAREYIPMGFVDSSVLCSNLVKLVPNAEIYHFGILESKAHMAWTRAVCGKMRIHYRYSKDIVYNNFPWPTPTDAQKELIEHTAQAILDARNLYPDKNLSDLYDPGKMPFELKTAHEANDRAVMDAYGFSSDMTEDEVAAELMKLYQELSLRLMTSKTSKS